jgi:hypothetical protein
VICLSTRLHTKPKFVQAFQLKMTLPFLANEITSVTIEHGVQSGKMVWWEEAFQV